MNLKEENAGEPRHTDGHSTAIMEVKEKQFMCPECGKTFENLVEADKHLYSSHWEHLRMVHEEFHKEYG
jgi:hypothetical protein